MTFEYIDATTKLLLTKAHKAEKAYIETAEPRQRTPSWLTHHEVVLLQPDWVAIQVCLRLLRPWYSRDDVPFHALHNPVRRDRVLGLPFMAASSWKGLLRWACRMECGLFEHLAKGDGSLRGWEDSVEIRHLFGAETRDDNASVEHAAGSGMRGALAFRPAWFQRGDNNKGSKLIGFELINPHDRNKRAGTNPITYEVVTAGAKAKLELLYAPSPGQIVRDGVSRETVLKLLLQAIESLLTTYGFSAKRTAGWGLAKIDDIKLERRGREPLSGSVQKARSNLSSWLRSEEP